MVKSKTDFSKIKMKIFLWHSSIRIEPVFSKTPESFNAIYMISSFWLTKLFSYHNVLTTYSQRRIRMPVISVVKTAWLCMFLNKPDKLLPTSALNWKNLDHPISFENTKDNDFPCCAPATLAFLCATKHCFITFKRSFKRLSQFLLQRTAASDNTVKPLDCCQTYRTPKPLPVYWHSKDKHFQKSFLCCFRQSYRIPYAYKCVTMSTLLTLVSSVREFVWTLLATFWTSFHIQTSLTLVRFA